MKMAERPTALKDSLTASHLDKESRTSEGFFRYTSKKKRIFYVVFLKNLQLIENPLRKRRNLNLGMYIHQMIKKNLCCAQ